MDIMWPIRISINEQVISKYVREQGQEKEYKKLYQAVEEEKQYSIWDYM